MFVVAGTSYYFGYTSQERKPMFIEVAGDRHKISEIYLVEPVLYDIHIWTKHRVSYKNGTKTHRKIFKNLSNEEKNRIFGIIDGLRK